MRAATFALAVALDACTGDPPTALHPVALVGAAARRLHAQAPAGERARRGYGTAVAAALPLAAAATATGLVQLGRRVHPLVGAGAAVTLASLTSALRTLCVRAQEVERALVRGELEAARSLAGRHLVSRDTAALDASEVAGATIASVAENLSDGVVAPWLAYACGGTGAAWAYRAANTLDALWGYRTREFEALGWGAARLDDALNLVPARATAAAIVGAAALPGQRGHCDARRALAVWRRDASRTASPNAGQPMAAMAGALGVRLAKRDAYTLGAELRAAAPADIGRAVALARSAAWLACGGVAGALLAAELAR